MRSTKNAKLRVEYFNMYSSFSTLFSNFIIDRAHSESGLFGARTDSDQP